MKKIFLSCLIATFVLSTGIIAQDKPTEQEVSTLKSLLEKKKMSDDQVNKMLEKFREMPKMQRDNYLDQMKDGLQRGIPEKTDKGEIDGVQRGKPVKNDKGEIDGVQRGEAIKDKMNGKKEEMENMKGEMIDAKEEMKSEMESVKDNVQDSKEVMKSEISSAKKELKKGSDTKWSDMKGSMPASDFGIAKSEWVKSNAERVGNLKEKVGKTAVRMEAASSKIAKAKERLNLKKENGELTEEQYNEKMSMLDKYQSRIKELTEKSMGKAKLIEQVEEQASSIKL